jgi:hypothetical protein
MTFEPHGKIEKRRWRKLVAEGARTNLFVARISQTDFVTLRRGHKQIAPAMSVADAFRYMALIGTCDGQKEP